MNILLILYVSLFNVKHRQQNEINFNIHENKYGYQLVSPQ